MATIREQFEKGIKLKDISDLNKRRYSVNIYTGEHKAYDTDKEYIEYLENRLEKAEKVITEIHKKTIFHDDWQFKLCDDYITKHIKE